MANLEEEVTEPRPAGAPPKAYVVRVSGELDMHHVDEVRSSLLSAITEAPLGAEVIIDLTYSSFCDSSGLNALLTARQRAAELGRTLRLGAPSHQMLRLMEITDTVGLFAMVPVRQDGEPDL
ncbi:STAS domain-containing protein [Streptomyces gardneri]|uniref:STAS domain-containing protein n=1 Tax=Streptomyces gardneri TaxID=66892 RepID=UPI0036B794D7